MINFGALRGALAAVRFGRVEHEAEVAAMTADAGRAGVEPKPADPVWTLGSTASLAGRLP